MSTDEGTTPPNPPHGDANTAAPKAAASEQSVVAALGISDALKRGFADYLEQNHVRPQSGSELNVDLEFMRNHAGPLLAHLLRSATQSVLPKDLRFTVPTPPPADKPEQGPVNVNFDLGDFLAKLFKPPSTNPPR